MTTAEEIFKKAWQAADEAGEEGSRVTAGLDALRAAGLLVGAPTEEQSEEDIKRQLDAIFGVTTQETSAENTLRLIRGIYEAGVEGGDVETYYPDPDGTLDKIWDVLNGIGEGKSAPSADRESLVTELKELAHPYTSLSVPDVAKRAMERAAAALAAPLAVDKRKIAEVVTAKLEEFKATASPTRPISHAAFGITDAVVALLRGDEQ